LLARGYDLGPFGPLKNGVDGRLGGRTSVALRAFQKSRGLPETGLPDALTAIALSAPTPQSIVPASWMPDARLERIICHWSAGTHKASGLDRTHYHIVIEGDGNLVRGMWPISANGIGKAGKRANHTLNLNTGSIGVSLACMAGAIERPFNAGRFPMTATQWATLPRVVADLCRRYGIPVTQRTVLSHAEVQPTLGVRQRAKWDVAWRVGMAAPGNPVAVGDELRHAVFNLLK
jgi:hypothetical protein